MTWIQWDGWQTWLRQYQSVCVPVQQLLLKPSDSERPAAELCPCLSETREPKPTPTRPAPVQEPAQGSPTSAVKRDDQYQTLLVDNYTLSSSLETTNTEVYLKTLQFILISMSLVCWCTCVNARCNSVSEVKLCRLCWRDRARACKSNGRAVAKPDESQWSSAEASITLPHKHTEELHTDKRTTACSTIFQIYQQFENIHYRCI